MVIVKKIVKYLFFLLLSIISYVFIAIGISYITVNKQTSILTPKKIYLSSNGVHLSIIVPTEELSVKLKEGLRISPYDKYIRFGWGDENFYLNTPTWNDFKVKYALGALFLNNPTLIEVSKTKHIDEKWIGIPIHQNQLIKLDAYLTASFKTDSFNNKIPIVQNIYPGSLLFKANGSYSPTKTCNTWVNSAFKESGLKASYWTLFDFGLLNKYQ